MPFYYCPWCLNLFCFAKQNSDDDRVSLSKGDYGSLVTDPNQPDNSPRIDPKSKMKNQNVDQELDSETASHPERDDVVSDKIPFLKKLKSVQKLDKDNVVKLSTSLDGAFTAMKISISTDAKMLMIDDEYASQEKINDRNPM